MTKILGRVADCDGYLKEIEKQEGMASTQINRALLDQILGTSKVLDKSRGTKFGPHCPCFAPMGRAHGLHRL